MGSNTRSHPSPTRDLLTGSNLFRFPDLLTAQQKNLVTQYISRLKKSQKASMR